MWEKRRSVLIVDDVEINRQILINMAVGYKYHEAANGLEALEILEKHYDDVDAILLDLNMPVLDGIGFLEERRKIPKFKKIPVIVVSGDDKIDTKIQAYEKYAINDYIEKPYHPALVRARLDNVVKLRRYEKSLEQRITTKMKQLEVMNLSLVENMANIVESRNMESGMHVKRVQRFTEVLATYVLWEYPEYGLTPEIVQAITVTSALHDIGKIQVPDSILTKPGPLTADEFAIMKMHTLNGAKIIESSVSFQKHLFSYYAYEIARSHHERYDGKGYPEGLVGESIPISAQIVGVADCFDALVTDRTYKKAFSYDTAYNMILTGQCGAFSEKMLKAFENVREEFYKVADEFKANNPAVGGYAI